MACMDQECGKTGLETKWRMTIALAASQGSTAICCCCDGGYRPHSSPLFLDFAAPRP